MHKDTVTVLLVGDVAARRPEPGRLFEHVAPLFRGADIAFGNQEWALSDRGQPWPGKAGRVVCCPPEGVEALTAAGFDVVSLANNHTMNYGTEGLVQTMEVLRQAGIAFCGGGANREEAHQPAILERKGTRVAFLAYTSIFTPGFAATDSSPGQATVKVETSYRIHPRAYEQPGAPVEFVFTPDARERQWLLEDVRRAKEQADVVVVSWHWGDSIGTKRVLSYQRDLGRQVIEAGADIIAGQGVHVLQGVEVVGKGVIVYGLGNFGFDMVESHRTYDSAVLKLLIRGGRVERVSLLPARIDADLRPRVVGLEEGTESVAQIEDQSREYGTAFRREDGELVVVRPA